MSVQKKCDFPRQRNRIEAKNPPFGGSSAEQELLCVRPLCPRRLLRTSSARRSKVSNSESSGYWPSDSIVSRCGPLNMQGRVFGLVSCELGCDFAIRHIHSCLPLRDSAGLIVTDHDFTGFPHCAPRCRAVGAPLHMMTYASLVVWPLKF